MIMEVEKNNIIFENKNPFEIERSDEQRKSIKEYWEDFINNNRKCYNGNVYNVTNIVQQNDKMIFEIGKTKFEDIVYAKEYSDFNTRCLFVATYFITINGYYCIIKNNRNVVNLIGGMADDKDFEDGMFNPIKCLNREVKEELGLDIRGTEYFSITLKYVKMPSKKEESNSHYPIGLIYETCLNMTSDELINKFKEGKCFTDGEIEEIISFKDYSELNYEKKASYLIELFERISSK